MSEIPMTERLEAGFVGDLASATHELRLALEAGRTIDYPRALELWLKLGNDLLRFGANRIAVLEDEVRAVKHHRQKVTR